MVTIPAVCEGLARLPENTETSHHPTGVTLACEYTLLAARSRSRNVVVRKREPFEIRTVNATSEQQFIREAAAEPNHIALAARECEVRRLQQWSAHFDDCSLGDLLVTGAIHSNLHARWNSGCRS